MTKDAQHGADIAPLESHSQRFLDTLEQYGYNFFTGVPCSFFKGILRLLDTESRYGYVSAVREDAALGMAAGAYLGGRQAAVFMQNSGLGVSINALTSLNEIYDIPVLLVISWRGEDGNDAPEHLIMGRKMKDLLALFHIPFIELDLPAITEQIGKVTRTMLETRKPVALLVSKGMLEA